MQRDAERRTACSQWAENGRAAISQGLSCANRPLALLDLAQPGPARTTPNLLFTAYFNSQSIITNYELLEQLLCI
jgi:hypothetical protein